MKKHYKHKLHMALALFAVILSVAGCKKDTAFTNQPTATLYEYVQADKQLTLYRTALKRAGMDSPTTFTDGGPLTVFAAVDSAFIAAGYTADKINSTTPQKMAGILKYNILYGRISSQSLVGFYLQDMRSKNDTLKPRLAKNYYGIFFDGIPLVPNGSRDFNDGVLHKLTRMALPAEDNIWGIISKTPSLSLYAAALQKLGMAEMLKKPPVKNPYTDGDFNYYYTVFAPNDDAFKKFGFPDVASINNSDGSKLQGAFSNFISTGKTLTSTFIGGYAISGQAVIAGVSGLTIITRGNINPTNIIRPDLMATNGVMDIVDQVFIAQ